jgi:hypothetical protein
MSTAKGWCNMPSASDPILRRASLRRRCRAWLLGAALCTCSAAAVTSDLYVVCNVNVTLRPGDVRDMFIGEKSFAGAVRLAPADNLAAQAAFLEKVLKVSAEKYASLWTKKSFRDGANPPPVKASDAEAIAYIRQTPGACSYAQSAPPGVSVVGKF